MEILKPDGDIKTRWRHKNRMETLKPDGDIKTGWRHKNQIETLKPDGDRSETCLYGKKIN